MSTRSTVYLHDRNAKGLVEATLVDGVTRAEAEKAEAEWKPYLEQQIKRMAAEGVPKDRWPQHRHWDWRQKQEAAEAYLAYRMFGIECQSQMTWFSTTTTVLATSFTSKHFSTNTTLLLWASTGGHVL